MAITLLSSPVTTVGGQVRNLFPGFLPVEFTFKREDLGIVSVEAGIDSTVKINISTDLTSYLSVGDYIYLYAPSDLSDYYYDVNAALLEVTSTYLRIDTDFIEVASSGYINYRKNYYLECQLVDTANPDIKKLPFTLKDDGDNAGSITIDVSIANDKNYQYFLDTFGELTNSRIKFYLQYREVYTGSSNPFSIISDEIILVYATEDIGTLDEFLNDFDMPELYAGYDNGIVMVHSDANSGTYEAIRIYYQEKDLNRNDINSPAYLTNFDADQYGLFFVFWDKAKTAGINSATRYIEFSGEYADLPEYDPTEYAYPDYDTL